MEVIDLDFDFFVVRFANRVDYAHVFTGGPWVIMGHYLVIQQWRPMFIPAKGELTRVAVWFRVPGFPVECYDQEVLQEIGRNVGRFVKVDDHTWNTMADKGQRGAATERARFARICVEVDLRKTLVSKFVFEDEEFKIEYEGLNMICFECGKFGHKKETCPHQKGDTGAQNATEQNKEAQPTTQGEDFGPWMIVKRPSRTTARRPPPKPAGGKGGGTRFSVLETMDIDGNQGISNFTSGNPENSGQIQIPKSNQPARNIPSAEVVMDKSVGPTSSSNSKNYKIMSGGQSTNSSTSLEETNDEPIMAAPTVTNPVPTLALQSSVKNPGKVNPNHDAYFAPERADVTNPRPTPPPQQNKVGPASSLGAASKGVPLLLKDLVFRHHVSCIALFEPRVSATKLPMIMKTVGLDDCFVVEAEGFSGGIWIFWSKSWGSVEVLYSHRQLVHLRIKPNNGQPHFLVTFVYGSPNVSLRDFLWRELRQLASHITEPWVVMGDFNTYLHASDKVGGGPPNMLSMSKFRNCIEECSLSDLGFKGPPFTWEGRGVKERIDWTLGNDQWLAYFPEASVLHLPKLKSDHKPMLLQLCENQEDVALRPFRFMAAWLTHEDFPRLVESSWNNQEAWIPASDKFREEAISWNRNIFGEIGRTKRKLMRRLEGINNRLRMAHVPYLVKLQDRLWKEYQKVLFQEELLWKQKSRVSWLNHGDKNTRFFHTATMTRRKRNKIEALSNDEGVVITNPHTLRCMAVEFFRHLYTSSGDTVTYHIRDAFPQLPEDELRDISKPLLAEEIKQAAFSMGALKAPGPDGLNPLFFQSQWHVIEQSVVNFIHECVQRPEKIKEEVLHFMRYLKRKKGWLAIKVDLEKAYDRLDWNFLRDTLLEVGLEQQLCDLILNCVSLSSFQIMFNGSKTDSFTPTRGIRQGDPLSPYLFVLCMERLAHHIQREVDNSNWKPIYLSKHGPPITHLFFADDLLLFGEAYPPQVNIMMKCLDEFSKASGQKVSKNKSHMFISPNVHRDEAHFLSRLAGIHLTSDLGKYLGVPLLHKAPTRATYNFILEKAQKRLSSWKASTLSLAGRVTLAKSVVASLPSYCMQTMLIPKSVCEKLDQLQRNFVWGSENGKRKVSQVSWEVICSPKKQGGLGFRRTSDFNEALLMKAGWELIHNPNSLWVRVLRGKYGCGTNVVPEVNKNNRESLIWRGIRSTWHRVISGCSWNVRDGTSARFWKDPWIMSGHVLQNLATNPIPHHDMDLPMADFYDLDRGWELDHFQHILPRAIVEEITTFHSVQPDGGRDEVMWSGTPSGEFSTKSAYDLICNDHSHRQEESIWKLIWSIKGPQRVRVFLWKLCNRGVLTNAIRVRRHMGACDLCPMCQAATEDYSHIFRDCVAVRSFWTSAMAGRSSIAFFDADWPTWVAANISGQFQGRMGVEWPRFFASTLSAIWRMRNDLVFNHHPHSTARIWYFMRALGMEESTSSSVQAPSLSTLQGQHQGIFDCSPTRNTLSGWIKPDAGWRKINVDGAMSYDRQASCGGVIRDEMGRWLRGFSWNFGTFSSANVCLTELMAVKAAVEAAMSLDLSRVIVESDSLDVINLLHEPVSTSHRYGHVVSSILHLQREHESLVFQYTPRECNSVADFIAKVGLSLHYGQHWFEHPFGECHSLILRDAPMSSSIATSA
ncbi:uncharacterized protein LOC130737018 [Lotus japonicus]|uniref:uncharacterized protein LOC130737018 n=1 Tax=Lotus japonicus TaxID=34305 RepID=UPI00258CC749|nr:uncharacterized protein LOC130737018 [Lotus japonicus]